MERLFDLNHAASGNFFFGRSRELSFFQRELFEPAANGCSRYYSLTGINRVGKSSLLKELCRRFRAEGHPDVCILETTLDKPIQGFWPYWIIYVLKPLLSQPWFDQILDEMDPADARDAKDCRDYFLDKENWAPLFQGDTVEDAIAKSYIEQLFPILCDAGKYVILVIDEFDKAGQVFGLREENFGWFRGLLQSNDRGLSVVTISRRSIRFIEQNCFGGSTFDGIFSKRGLFGYSNSEIDAYFALLEQHGLVLSEEQRKEIWYYCGRSPFYLAIMGEALLEDPSAHIDAVSSQFFDSFEAVISLLKEEDLLTAMLQMFVGPRYNMSESDIQKLVAMGYCMKRASLDCGAGAAGEYANYFAPEDTGEYLTISGYFIDYLSDVHQKEADGIWPKLSHTERGLRRIIINEYERLYPDTWKEKLKEIALKKGTENVHEGFLREHDKVYRRADADQQKLVGNSILNVISLKALGGIIKADWAVFQKYFSCGRQRFSDDILVLYHARNPISHSNGELLTPADIAAVEDICNQFLTSIDCAAAAAPSPRR